jgi:morphogenetic protein associated with SpoVID
MSVKIHVVQSGETLSKIAQRYNVELDKIKELNTHLANPENIMPGMKIKIPSVSKPVKKETVQTRAEKLASEKAKKEAVHPYIDQSPKAKPVVSEDESEMLEKQMLPLTQPIMEMPKAPPIPELPVQEAPVQQEQPTEQKQPVQQPVYPAQQQPMYYQQPQVPYHYCYYMPVHKPCGCGGKKYNTFYMPVYPAPQYQSYPFYGGMYQQGYPQVQPSSYGMGGSTTEQLEDMDDDLSEVPEIPTDMPTNEMNAWGSNYISPYPSWNTPYQGFPGYPVQQGFTPYPYSNLQQPFGGYPSNVQYGDVTGELHSNQQEDRDEE